MSKKKATAISLPLSRTQKIMVSAVGVQSVTQDIVALTTKATEIFLMDFARRAYDQSSDEEFRSNVLEYDDIQKLVHSDPRYDFLIDTTPKRMKFCEALKLVEEAKRRQEALDSLDPVETKADTIVKSETPRPELKEITEHTSENNPSDHQDGRDDLGEEPDEDEEEEHGDEEDDGDEEEEEEEDNHGSQDDESELQAEE